MEFYTGRKEICPRRKTVQQYYQKSETKLDCIRNHIVLWSHTDKNGWNMLKSMKVKDWTWVHSEFRKAIYCTIFVRAVK